MAAPIQYGQYRVPEAEECVHFGVGQVCNCIQLRRARQRTVSQPFWDPISCFLNKDVDICAGLLI
jgi:hypothetical protein